MGNPSLGQIDFLLGMLKQDDKTKEVFDYEAKDIYEMLGSNTDAQHKRLLALLFNKKYEDKIISLEESGLSKK